MDRLTEQHPTWIDDEFWTAACEPDDEEMTNVYLKLKDYEDTWLEPEEVVALKDAEQKRRDGCQRCWNGECMMSGIDYSCETTCDKCRYNLRDKHFCPDCGRDLRGESHD